MGAHNCTLKETNDQTSGSCSLCGTLGPKWSRNQSNSYSSQSRSSDAFIMKHLKNNKQTDKSIGINSLDNRRLVFVHLPGLYKTWRQVPSILLYTSLMLMPLKQEWIQYPAKYQAELQHSICVPCGCSNVTEITDFIHLLQWKSSQDLVLWALNDSDPDGFSAKIHKFAPNPLVTPFWYRVSAKLTSLYDHIAGTFYQPLTLEEEYWANRSTFCSKYKTKKKAVLRELYFVTMQPNAMQEIIYQSNPQSLHPVVEYKNKYNLNVSTGEMQLISPLSPVVEQENETRFAFNCVSPEDRVRIDVFGITPEDLQSPPAYVQTIKA